MLGRFLLGLILSVSFIYCETLSARITTFKILYGPQGEESSYSVAQYTDFIKKLRELFQAGNTTASIAIIDELGTELPIGISFGDLYLRSIDGYDIRNVTYSQSRPHISNTTINEAFESALAYDHISYDRKKEVLKFLAFIISEAARFTEIEEVVNSALNSPFREFHWVNYLDLMHNWGITSNENYDFVSTHQGPHMTAVASPRTRLLAGISRVALCVIQANILLRKNNPCQ